MARPQPQPSKTKTHKASDEVQVERARLASDIDQLDQRIRKIGLQVVDGVLATEDAKANAERIASSLGVKLGSVRTVIAGGASPPPMPMQEMLRVSAMASDGAAGKASNYVPGEISFESRVDATFDVVAP